MSKRRITIPPTAVVRNQPWPFQVFIKQLCDKDVRFGKTLERMRQANEIEAEFAGAVPGGHIDMGESLHALLVEVAKAPAFGAQQKDGSYATYDQEIMRQPACLAYIEALVEATKVPAHPTSDDSA
jgi:hypothetical protein